MSLSVSFYGGAGTVTGSRFLVRTETTRLLVDCGLFQGLKNLRRRNWAPPGFDPALLDAVVLTHAHIDHSGYVPVVIKRGFTGPIFCSEPTADLCGILLPDSGYLQEEDAKYADRRGFSKHRPALPLYTRAEAEASLRLLRPVGFGEEVRVGDLSFRLVPAGHILGAAGVRVTHQGRTIHFSGDLGRSDDSLMRPPAPLEPADWVVLESTYGDRLHDEVDPLQALRDVLERTFARGGLVLIPAFAVGRAQLFMLLLDRIFRADDFLRVPVFLNSPMATDVSRLYRRHAAFHRLDVAEIAGVLDRVQFVRSVEESIELNGKRGPMVVVSASGMLTGGRVLHHLKAYGPDHRNTILLGGFQASGTRGEQLLQGARELKVHGKWVPIRAEVVSLPVFSAHADQGELLSWVGDSPRRPRRVLLVHGEPRAADALRLLVEDRLGVDAEVAEAGQTIDLG